MITMDYRKRQSLTDLPNNLAMRFIGLKTIATVVRLDAETWGFRYGQGPWNFGTREEVAGLMLTMAEAEPYQPRGVPDVLPPLDFSDLDTINFSL